MRLLEEYKKSGFFWLPSNSDHKVPGTLQVFDGGKIELEIMGLLDESLEALNGQEDLSRVVGHIEKDGYVTLENCFYTQKGFPFAGVSKSRLYAQKMLAGVAYDEGEVILINEFDFSIEGMNEWVNISGLNVQFDPKGQSTASYLPPKEIISTLNNGMDLIISFEFSWQLPQISHSERVIFSQRTFFKLVSTKPRLIDEFLSIAFKMTNFLCFAVDKTVSLTNVIVRSEEIFQENDKNSSYQLPIKVFYESRSFSEDPPKISSHDMLFGFKDIKDNFTRIINEWMDAYEIITPTLGLYFAAKSGGHQYLDGRFLALVQGLETYHRRTSNETQMDHTEFRNLESHLIEACPEQHREWLTGKLRFANEITLSKRIKRIIEPFKSRFGNGQTRNKLVRDIVDTRNYYTHYNPDLKSNAAQKKELLILCQKLEVLFQLQLLKEIGFTHEEIELILDKHYKLKQRLVSKA